MRHFLGSRNILDSKLSDFNIYRIVEIVNAVNLENFILDVLGASVNQRTVIQV